MTKLQYITKATSLSEKNIQNTLNLLEQDATIPFISRYRKEMTGNLDEVQIGEIVKYKLDFEALEKRKTAISKAIEEQGELTDALQEKLQKTTSLTTLEDLYLPFKKKRKTKASTARENGLEPLAKIIMQQQDQNINGTAKRFIKNSVTTTEDALIGARHIIAEWINENEWVRKKIRNLYKRTATLSTKIINKEKETEKAQKYRNYFDWEEALYKAPSHRLLAILRAEQEGIIRIKININKEKALEGIDNIIIKTNVESCTNQIFLAIEDSYKRLLQPAISNEVLKEAKTKADAKAIQVFATNLKQLLLSAPLGEKRILALDPGFKSGCKVVCLAENGDLLEDTIIYPHAPQKRKTEASETIKHLAKKHKIEAIAIGNGTASRESESFVKSITFSSTIEIFVVNEAGASIYSASKIAREEFPNKDVTVRGAVSIGRRLADPLAELVKIDAKSIGVGQYQHDVDQLLLKTELDNVVASCVNHIGVNVNTASAALLSYVSGIGKTIANNIVTYRSENGSISSRTELKKIPRLGAKAFEQSAGFLRIREGENPLDNSSVHPERYKLITQIAKDQYVSVVKLIGNTELLSQIKLQKYCTENVGLPTLQDIINELKKPGIDPREKAKAFSFDENLQKIEDVKIGMKIPGIINNITNFGCFINIGIKQSGLAHISKLSNKFISDPNEVVQLNQQIYATVIDVDYKRGRIQLSLIE